MARFFVGANCEAARWRSGYAAACKAVNTGSIPVRASSLIRCSSAVEQAAVNR